MHKLLIANRGEIAARIARSARKMGIATVAIYSDADAGAVHVRAADQAVRIGPAPVGESYLRAEAILEAAKATGADAVHPGYGFLSENPDFAEAVEAAGLIWVGPPAAAIRAMGLKDEAKRRMEAAGVPVTPGYHGPEQDPDLLAARAGEIGYPVLIKAAAGGGGKGMRLVEAPGDFAAALARARSEAASAFGNDRVLIEKFIDSPRHIEVQVFADRHGQTVHLYERDCSAQRRHQKVIEEAPAPGMTEALRAAMTGAAMRAAEAVGYVGAGTVEFIVDGGRMAPDAFFFMEMNTRLQVEHPVTEAVTGTDLVAWQLRIARGEPLPLAQDQIPLLGHAVEARLYAEDPARDFRPQTGRLAALRWPEGVRVDTGVAEGDPVTPHYDPMLAKLIAHAPDRAAAFATLSAALAATHLAGVTSNLGFLARLATDPEMLSGRIDTGLIARRGAAVLADPAPEAADLALAAAALVEALDPAPAAFWRPWGPGRAYVALTHGGDGSEEATVALSVRRSGAGLSIEADTPLGAVGATLIPVAERQWRLSDGKGHGAPVHLHQDAAGLTLVRGRARHRFALANPLIRSGDEGPGGDAITAPLPGLVKTVDTTAGAAVSKGVALAVLEAMKMEHALTAPRDGRVAEVLAAPGDQVAEGALLIRLEPEGEP
ncbi:MAG: biotin carboxylase N-terminal domain-containing protein [Pseudomonadota bacterium]